MNESEHYGNIREGGRIYILCFVLLLLVFCTAGAASDVSKIIGEEAVSFGERAGTWDGQTIFAWLSFILGICLVLLLVWHGYCNQQERKLWMGKVCVLTEALVKNTEMLGKTNITMEKLGEFLLMATKAINWCKHHSGNIEEE